MKRSQKMESKKKHKVFLVVGARPNIMKISAVWKALRKYPHLQCRIIHTGQHYDENLSAVFFLEFGLPKPYRNLGAGSASRSKQIAEIRKRFTAVCKRESPALVIVAGDTNSTLGAALAARDCAIPVAHVEAGLRSFDQSMPEELNRIATDTIARYLFVTERSAINNLRREGTPRGNIFFTGNTMIDTLMQQREKIRASQILAKLSLRRNGYSVMTFHRPSNVDKKHSLENVLSFIGSVAHCGTVVLPLHQRTRRNLQKYHLLRSLERIPSLVPLPPLGYHDFLHLVLHAKFVVTDSGGIQEEATYLKVPCFTLRDNTERPSTIAYGTNVLLGTEIEKAKSLLFRSLKKKRQKPRIPEKWDGRAAERIASIIAKEFERR